MLTSKERAELRAQSNGIDTTLMVGKSGVTETVIAEAENQKVLGPTTHETLLIHMQLSVSEFVKARKLLEAVGLIKTFKEGKRDEIKSYEYFIYAPKTPKSFFEDTLLFGMLIKYVGEAQAKRLHTIYKVTFQEAEGEEVSATFGEVFHPDFSDPAFSTTDSTQSIIKQLPRIC